MGNNIGRMKFKSPIYGIERREKQQQQQTSLKIKASEINETETPVGKYWTKSFVFILFRFVSFGCDLSDRFVHWTSAIIPPPKLRTL